MLLNKNKTESKEWNIKEIRNKIENLNRVIDRRRNQMPTLQEKEKGKENAQLAIMHAKPMKP